MNSQSDQPSGSSSSMPLLQQRRETRRLKDPHHNHPFKRIYIGPSHVATRAASSVAAAIAQDLHIERPTTISVIGGQGSITSTSGAAKQQSTDSAIVAPHVPAAEDSSSIVAETGDETSRIGRSLFRRGSKHSLRSQASFSASPTKRTRELAPLSIPRTTDIALVQQRSRTGSYDGTERRPSHISFDEEARRGILRNPSDRRRMSHSMFESVPVSPTKRQQQHSSQHDSEQHHRLTAKQRRQHSESSALDGPQHSRSPLTGQDGGGSGTRGRNVVPLLDLSVDEEDPQRLLTASPEQTRFDPNPHQDHTLRHAASHLSEGTRSALSGHDSIIQHKLSSSTINAQPTGSRQPQTPHQPRARSSLEDAKSTHVAHVSPAVNPSSRQKRSDPPNTAQTEQTGNLLTDSDTMQKRQKSRVDEMRERARERYINTRIGQNVAFSSLRSPKAKAKASLGAGPADGQPRKHYRDASRQSRLSYISATGTQTSVGTRLSEGSFGATGGFRAKLARKFGFESASSGGGRRNKIQSPLSVRANARRHGRQASYNSRGGVVPGAVGTSAGGTKWVGQSFEVGQRFWEAMLNCEEDLCFVMTADEETSKLEAVREEDDDLAAARKHARKMRQGASDASFAKSPSDVLFNFAKEASDAQDSGMPIRPKDPAIRRNTTPALIVSGSDSEPSDELPVTPKQAQHKGMTAGFRSSQGQAYAKSEPTAPLQASQQEHHELERVNSAASLLTVPQDREALSSWDIENRKGWSDVVSFITAQNSLPSSIQRSARSAGDVGMRAKHAFDGQVADYRARQAAAKQTREQRKAGGANDVSRLTIDEGTSGVENDGVATPTQRTVQATTARTMTQRDLLERPEAPVEGMDNKMAEATFELTRRPSLPGIIPGSEAINDAASDHEVAAKPTFEIEPAAEEVSQHTHHKDGTSQTQASTIRSALQSTQDNGVQKKSVQFKNALSGRMPPQRSLTVDEDDLLAQSRPSPMSGSSSGAEDKLTLLAGRFRPAVRSGDAAPAPPEEVLSRNATPDEKSDGLGGKTNAGFRTDDDAAMTTRSELKRDRMLVKVAWTPSEDVHKEFTERESRKYEMHADPFREFMVVYRMGRLELWDDPSWAARVFGHADELKLRYVAPLRRGRAFVSLYSPIDLIFCVTFIPDHTRSLFNLRRSGTHLWFFDARSGSNSADWMWELWRELGGEIPDAIDVSVPVMGTRIRIPIPTDLSAVQLHSHKAKKGSATESDDAVEHQFGEGYKVISLQNVVRIVTDLLSTFSQWNELRQSLVKSGMQFGLAWRTQMRLNWIQYSDTTEGLSRDWEVLVGSILCDTKAPSTLEFRAMTHYPHKVRTAHNVELVEPPAIEGFIWRVKAASGALTRLYVTTQDGLLFVNRPSRAFPPERIVASDVQFSTHQLRRASAGSIANLSFERKSPRRGRRGSKSSGIGVNSAGDESLAAMGRRVINMLTLVPASLEELDAQMEAYRGFEKRRMFEQIVHADGYIDVRDIFMVKTLDEAGPVRRPSSESKPRGTNTLDGSVAINGTIGVKAQPANQNKSDDDNEELDGSDSEEDLGGEEGYEVAKDRAALKRSRQIEVVLANGRSIRLECYSKSVAREWVERLGDISQYWKRREKVDALESMNASGYDPQLIQRKLQTRRDPRPLEQAADSERLAPLLGSVWNWCILDACRTIVRSGQLFTKRKPYTAFASRYCILVSGRLLTYRMMTSTRTARARQNAGIFHKRQETVIHLRDCYVYSGKLTDHMLVNGRSDGAGAISSTYGAGSGGAATSSTRHTLPRVYADGLLSTDEDEECTFVIRYRPQRVNHTTDPQVSVESDLLSDHRHRQHSSREHTSSPPRKQSNITTLRDSTINVIALRARSMLERDLWVWAINAERERIVRDDKTRESQIRHLGKTPYRSHHS